MIGIDLGGTKIEAVALDASGAELFRERVATPRHDYAATIAAITALATRAADAAQPRNVAEAMAGRHAGIGVAIPGTVSRLTGLVKNANSTWLNGRPLQADLEATLGCHVVLANDANCFVLSEATDGAGAGCHTVFGVIAGTGLGGGIAVEGKVLQGAHGIGGEWGHTPLPAMTARELAEAPSCWCGNRGCIETWLSGPALAEDHARHGGHAMTAEQIAQSDDAAARAAMARFTERFARALAVIVNVLDPDVIVLGGGLSSIESLYRDLPPMVEKLAFSPEGPTRIVKNKYGDSSGVRGAAWLAPRPSSSEAIGHN